MLIISNIGDHVWLITSKHTEPDLGDWFVNINDRIEGALLVVGIQDRTYSSSMFGWKIRFTNPMLGDL